MAKVTLRDLANRQLGQSKARMVVEPAPGCPECGGHLFVDLNAVRGTDNQVVRLVACSGCEYAVVEP